MNKCEQIGD